MIPVLLIGAAILLLAKSQAKVMCPKAGDWRLYRLPGSRALWHVDSGDGTPRIDVNSFECQVPTVSIDRGVGSPRAWIQIDARKTVMQLRGNRAVWLPSSCKAVVCERL